MKKSKTYINKPTQLMLHGHEVSVDLSPIWPFAPSTVNDAELLDEAYNSGVDFIKPIITDDGYAVSDLKMIVPEGLKIGQIFDRMPYGIINKTITGLGATTLEIETPKRSSIIVVPTKTLAYSKSRTANEKFGDGYSMYIGSPIGENKSNITLNSVRKYIEGKQHGEVQKFIVVADSLPILLNFLDQLEINVYSNYFLMVDEIDTLQLDSSYRPKLEIVMDYYFKFDFNNRALVSATIISFSNPKLSKESSLRIEWQKQPIRKIKLQYANFIEDAAVSEINNLLQTTNDKILVAYNSLDGIFNIIEQLDISKDECGILCSDRSSDKVADYKDNSDKAIDENGILTNRVTFMTCAYFAGIDIEDKCHLITISSKNTAYTYLSAGKMTQIAGRCRQGNLSETILFDVSDKRGYDSYSTEEEYRTSLVTRAAKYSSFLNDARAIIAEDKDLLPMEHFISSFIDYISKSKPTYFDYPLSIIRQHSIDNKFEAAYFNIDSLVEKWILRNTLYSSDKSLLLTLQNEGHNVTLLEPYIVKKEEHIVPDKTARKEANLTRRMEVLKQLKADLLQWKKSHGNQYALNEIASKVDKRIQDTVVLGFNVLHPYYPSEELIDKLIDGYLMGKGFRNIYNAALFHALSIEETFKIKILMKFGCDFSTGESHNYITAKQRINLVGEAFVEAFRIYPKTNDRNLAELASSFLKFKDGKGGQYRPSGLNPHDLPTPIYNIPLGLLNPTMFMLPREKDSIK